VVDGKVLAVEDDLTLLELLAYSLKKEGHHVLTATDGAEAIEVARAEKPDLIILDLMLPGVDGLEVCRILRKETAAPIVMLTAKTAEIDKIVGLELGADDYVTKPFSMRELMARVKAALRRTKMMRQEDLPSADAGPAPIRIGELEVDFAQHRVLLAGSAVELSPKEFDLLAFLVKHRHQVFSRDHLLEHVWGYEYAGDTRTVDVHIRWLRQKIEDDPPRPQRLLTVRGVGYKFEG